MPLPTWAVVAMVEEPAPLVLAFVQHMLAIGATGVDLFLDKPNAQAQEMLAATPGCRVTVVDDAFWDAVPGGGRPSKKPSRQFAVAEIAYRRCEADWLLHCDCDEFLRQDTAFLTELAAAPDDVTHMTLRVGERVWTGPTPSPYGGVFRRMHADYETFGPQLHGEHAPYFISGLSGHIVGKSLTRTGRALRPTVHFAVPSDGSGFAHGKPEVYVRSSRILHFDGITPLHFAIKMLRHVYDTGSDAPRTAAEMPPHRLAQMAQVPALVADPAALAGLVMRIMSLTPVQADMLRERNLLDEVPFRPRVTPEVAAMLSPAGIDKRLRARHFRLLKDHAPSLLDAATWDRHVREAAGWSGKDEAAGAKP